MSDLLVLGGGVMGMAIAWEALGMGLSVTLLEKDACGAGASQASAGILSPAGKSWEDPPLNALCWAGIRRYPDWVASLQEAAQGDPRLHMEGVLYPIEENTAGRAQSLKHVGLEGEWLEGKPLAGEFGWLNLSKALFIKEEGRIQPRLLLFLLRDALVARACDIREGTHVVQLEKGASGFSARTSKGEAIGAERLAVATGAWPLKSPQGWAPPVKPMRGQLIALTLEGAAAPTRTLHGEAAYLVPQGGGGFWVGSMVEDKGWDASIDRSLLHRKIAQVAQWAPGIARARVGEAWCGFRPGSPDNRPMLGERTGEPGVFWATGLFRNGILLAPEAAHRFGLWWRGGGAEDREGPFAPGRFS